jgi:excisionase family DNA binding protein
VSDASRYANVSERTIYGEIAAGRLRAAVVGGRRSKRLKRDWIDQWLEATAAPTEERRSE